MYYIIKRIFSYLQKSMDSCRNKKYLIHSEYRICTRETDMNPVIRSTSHETHQGAAIKVNEEIVTIARNEVQAVFDTLSGPLKKVIDGADIRPAIYENDLRLMIKVSMTIVFKRGENIVIESEKNPTLWIKPEDINADKSNGKPATREMVSLMIHDTLRHQGVTAYEYLVMLKTLVDDARDSMYKFLK